MDKTYFLARVSIDEFFERHQSVFFWTFSAPGDDRPAEVEAWRDKDHAAECFKPFADMCRRRGINLLCFWELQQRGVWHVHCLLDTRLDVNWLRPWMVARGWGQQMLVIRFWYSHYFNGNGYVNGWRSSTHGVFQDVENLKRYLLKYLTKSRREMTRLGTPGKKSFGGSRGAKRGTVAFDWAPWVNPCKYLYNAGIDRASALRCCWDSWSDVWRKAVIEGVHVTGWDEHDWLWMTCHPAFHYLLDRPLDTS